MSSEMEQAPQELDWVTERAKCTIRSVFKRLLHEIVVDVARRNDHLTDSQKSNGVCFSVKEEDEEAFVVERKGQGYAGAVSFVILGSFISATSGVGSGTIQATIGMNDSGRCMLRIPKVNGQATEYHEIETWQFRKKAMESLFFPDAFPSN